MPSSLTPHRSRRRTGGAGRFRRIALGLDGAFEGEHMGHPDFRVNDRIFATIHPDHDWGMVKLTLEDQKRLVREHPGAIAPENGAWGRNGATKLRFDAVDDDTMGEALTLAWQNVVSLLRGQRSGRKVRRPR